MNNYSCIITPFLTNKEKTKMNEYLEYLISIKERFPTDATYVAFDQSGEIYTYTCKPITDEYKEWFTTNNMNEWFTTNNMNESVLIGVLPTSAHSVHWTKSLINLALLANEPNKDVSINEVNVPQLIDEYYHVQALLTKLQTPAYKITDDPNTMKLLLSILTEYGNGINNKLKEQGVKFAQGSISDIQSIINQMVKIERDIAEYNEVNDTLVMLLLNIKTLQARRDEIENLLQIK